MIMCFFFAMLLATYPGKVMRVGGVVACGLWLGFSIWHLLDLASGIWQHDCMMAWLLGWHLALALAHRYTCYSSTAMD